MSFFGLLFLIFLGWIVYNVARIYLRVRAIRRQGQDIFNQFMGGFGGANPAGSNPGGGQSPQPEPEPKRPAKKIDPDVGEYVRFEEITVTTEESSTLHADGTQTDTTRVTVEDQVVDVEWEDLPPADKK